MADVVNSPSNLTCNLKLLNASISMEKMASNDSSSTITSSDKSSKNTKMLRRNRPGTKLENAYQNPHISLEELDSAFALQEYIQSLVRTDKENIDALVNLPPKQDKESWQYEHLRQFCLELTFLVVQLSTECTRETCPEMKVINWMYLCAMHQAQIGCCAIDYIVHTLDAATTLLNSHRYFPSRISIPPSSLKHFQQIARRLYRIFAHAYFHHREIFESFEASVKITFSRMVSY
ncbi:4740_t:CDS:2 [Ambispora leptoticha]|uniref:4740_t:CDS:1 n=1 Tax=Ambispora leptoticha TaxID=144679 RepID=A0A9N9CN29_9GLOM|nr:4740_t:CDS:2 [Ambispora leptoticha]